MLDRIHFLLSEAMIALRRNTWMSFSAVTTCAFALFLLGTMGYSYLSLRNYADALGKRMEISVFLKDLTKEQISKVAEQIRATPGVKSAFLVSKEDAWSAYQKRFGDAITPDLPNPLPDSFTVKVENVKQTDEIAAALGRIDGVEERGVKYLSDVQQLLSSAIFLVRWLGLTMGGLMALICGVLIYNTIRLTIVARRREIRIMHLVGATRATIVTPLLIEGIAQGVLGGIFATSLIALAHSLVRMQLQSVSLMFQLPEFAYGWWLFCLGLIGAGYGLICSFFAVRDPRGIR